MNEKKDYVIKIKNSHAYIRNTIDYKINEYTFDLKLAKRFRMIDANNILKVNDKELEISKYEKEDYIIKNNRYKIFTNVLRESIETNVILSKDVKKFFNEIETEGIYTACVNLAEKYPESKFIKELDRLSEKIEFKNNCKGIPEKYKRYKEICEDYDYDEKLQLDILILALKEKYMYANLIEEEENELE